MASYGFVLQYHTIPHECDNTVTVPQGVHSGQTIHVATPDGSGRLIAAVVPPGMGPGSKFMVQAPPPVSAPAPAPAPPMAEAIARPVSASPASDPAPFAAALDDTPPSHGTTGHSGGYQYRKPAPPVSAPSAPATSASAPPASDPMPFSMALDNPPPPPQHHHAQVQAQTQQAPQYVKVQVPPGTTPGTTLHVQIPNSGGKLIAAQVPPNCTEFHVQYTL
eukprot:CAMPEP_0198124456 /NCGR_PEP_ID=MMETSP1442-20131203/39936_1 /TAXON_ID= /ORGANISM="Craspedostauros australis, Strain CCMP3328" /LENGTH=219 /DNA_ID=CAMNT_0043783843 /DNA_START=10 /DNA_END=669 /DNA_ORIENTATION=+